MRLLRGLNLVAVNHPFAERAAKDERRDHAERGSRDADRRAARDAVGVFKERTEGRGRAETAHHGNGTGENAVMLIKPHRLSDRHADEVLQHHEDRNRDEEGDEECAALLDQLQARHKADRRIEGKHQKRLQRRIKMHLNDVHAVENRKHDGEQNAADHRARNRVLLENADVLLHPDAEIVREHRERERLNGAYVDEEHSAFERIIHLNLLLIK